ncbi:MAG: hypothetical protein HW416_2653 [Chloroflexi bacterium]|nr:hypothetical protein [Chloroflexota bacterium]
MTERQELPVINPVAARSLFVLEPIADMMQPRIFTEILAKVQIGAPSGKGPTFTASGSSSIEALWQVGRHEIDMAVANPSAVLTMAYRGAGPFKEPMDVRVVATIPSIDWLGIAVAESTGLNSLAEVKERKFPLKLSLYERPGESQDIYTDALFAAYGFSLDDIVSWGGSVSRDPGLWIEDRYTRAKAGEIDAIIDEGIEWFIPRLGELGMRLLAVEEPILAKMAALGLHSSVLPRKLYPNLPGDIVSLDFSGWPVYTHSAAPDHIIYAFCRGLESRMVHPPYRWAGFHDGDDEVNLADLCNDTILAPLKIPLHPAAERYWRDAGHIA